MFYEFLKKEIFGETNVYKLYIDNCFVSYLKKYFITVKKSKLLSGDVYVNKKYKHLTCYKVIKIVSFSHLISGTYRNLWQREGNDRLVRFQVYIWSWQRHRVSQCLKYCRGYNVTKGIVISELLICQFYVISTHVFLYRSNMSVYSVYIMCT